MILKKIIYIIEHYDMIAFLEEEEKCTLTKIAEHGKKPKTNINTKTLAELVEKIFVIWSLIHTLKYFTQPITDENIIFFIETVKKKFIYCINDFKCSFFTFLV